tara:strand:+ start:219 stop:569 length:351 start_codon:yes stop_codon:yes gene_type:complete
MYITIKVLLTAIIVVAISEITRRSTIIAGILASIPLTSLLAIIWIFFDTNDINNIKELSRNILIMIPPSLVFFICLPVFLNLKIDFYASILLSILLTAFFYWFYLYILSFFGIRLN